MRRSRLSRSGLAARLGRGASQTSTYRARLLLPSSLAIRCDAMRCCAVLCGAVRCGAVLCGAVRCCAVLCGAVRCCAVLCCAVLCGAMRCDAMRCDAMGSNAMRCDAMRWDPALSSTPPNSLLRPTVHDQSRILLRSSSINSIRNVGLGLGEDDARSFGRRGRGSRRTLLRGRGHEIR